MIEAVLFDGDQTLWDFERIMAVALAATLAELQAARPGCGAEVLTVADLTADRTAVAVELEGVEFNLARLRRLAFARTLRRLERRDWNEADDDELVETLSVSYFAHRDRDPALFTDTLPCLELLRTGYRLGLLSNGSRLPETIGLGGIFETVVFAQDHLANKPDRALFEVVERELGVEPDRCVLVGDHELNDVVGAKRSGWRAVWLDRTGRGVYVPPLGCHEVPDAIVSSLEELPAVLAQLSDGVSA